MPVEITWRNSVGAIFSGYGLLFGDDGSGLPPFMAETGYQLSLVPKKPILFEHNDAGARGIIEGKIGEVIAETPDRHGIHVTGMLDLRTSGVRELIPEIDAGKIAFSVGGHPPLIKFAGGLTVRYPVIEWSLTRKPRDWRLLGTKYDNRIGLPGIEFTYSVKNGKLYEKNGLSTEMEIIMQLAKRGNKISIIDSEGSIAPPSGFIRHYFNIKRY